MVDLLVLPMPTVAAGCVLAHDAVIMRVSRGLLYMSEVDVGIKTINFFGSCSGRRSLTP